MTVPLAEVDLRVGGRYCISMLAPDGTDYRVTGVYRVVEPPSRLVYTWCFPVGEVDDSLVTIDFLDRGASTEIVLRHEALPTPEVCKRHEDGWSGILGRFIEEY